MHLVITYYGQPEAEGGDRISKKCLIHPRPFNVGNGKRDFLLELICLTGFEAEPNPAAQLIQQRKMNRGTGALQIILLPLSSSAVEAKLMFAPRIRFLQRYSPVVMASNVVLPKL